MSMIYDEWPLYCEISVPVMEKTLTDPSLNPTMNLSCSDDIFKAVGDE
jgi:hypothetical protein